MPSLHLEDFPALLTAERHSSDVVTRLQAALNPSDIPASDYIAVIIVGSYGRGEASADSDFEWVTIYDDRHVAAEEAILAQAKLTQFFADHLGRERLSINKTFGQPTALSRLLTNVGGEADSNRTLTYRMLALVEGLPLMRPGFDRVIRGLATTYGDTHTAGHRLLSLATDIARYWRTLRIDYKFKVDEQRKPWALRSVKLRSYRRIWYFSSALYSVAKGPRIDNSQRGKLFDPGVVAEFMAGMGGNPVRRFLTAIDTFELQSPLARALLETYDRIHQLLGQPEVREELNRLTPENMDDSEWFGELRQHCRHLHQLASDLVLQLPNDAPKFYRREVLEMFLL